MSEVATRPASAIATIGHSGSLIPKTLAEAMRLAEVMASARAMPKHLAGDVGSCFMIIEQAQRWNMSPFLVAQGTSNIGGKLCYEGKLIAAAITSTGGIIGEFDYKFSGDPKKPEGLSVTVSALRASDRQRKELTLAWKDARTENKFWLSQPEQQLCYAGARVWARRWTPGPMLGVYAPEESGIEFEGVTVDAETAPPEPSPPPPEPPKRTAASILADLEVEFNGAKSREELEAICEREPIKKALTLFGVSARERFQALLDIALDRVALRGEGVAGADDDGRMET